MGGLSASQVKTKKKKKGHITETKALCKENNWATKGGLCGNAGIEVENDKAGLACRA